jgi:hypothetical protein
VSRQDPAPRPDEPLTTRHGLPVHEDPTDPEHHPHVGEDTVEAAVRRQLSTALGGKRGMAEAAVPTIAFTATFVATKDVKVAVGVSVGLALVLLAVRLVQRSSVQFVLNALFGIGIGVLFVWLGGPSGEDADNYVAALGVLKVVMGWPLQIAALTFMVWLLSRNRTPVAG